MERCGRWWGRCGRGWPIVPEMETGASDSKITMASGMPQLWVFQGWGLMVMMCALMGGMSGLAWSRFIRVVEFDYLYLKALTGK
ncbi:MAG: hypothetical protein WDN23_12410 [Edaphobacter sp.]